MITVGIFGTIGSGKSEVAKVFAEKGAIVISADDIGREVVDQKADVLKSITIVAIVEKKGERRPVCPSIKGFQVCHFKRRIHNFRFGGGQCIQQLHCKTFLLEARCNAHQPIGNGALFGEVKVPNGGVYEKDVGHIGLYTLETKKNEPEHQEHNHENAKR